MPGENHRPPQDRRQFLKEGALALAGVLAGGATGTVPGGAGAVEPIQRTPARRFNLSCAAYSFRKYLNLKNPTMSLEEFIEKCAGWETDGVELTEYYFKKPITPEYLIGLKRKAMIWGQDITGTPVGNNFALPPGKARDRQVESLKRWIDISADLGSPAIRIFAGSAPRGVKEEEARKWVVECIERCGEAAARRGVFLAIENHGGVVATAGGMLDIIRALRCEWVGVNLDTGNFHTPDPYGDLARIAPYAVTCQLKVHISSGGKQADVDLARIRKILEDANYRGYVTLEYEASEDPMTAVPAYLKKMRKVFG